MKGYFLIRRRVCRAPKIHPILRRLPDGPTLEERVNYTAGKARQSGATQEVWSGSEHEARKYLMSSSPTAPPHSTPSSRFDAAFYWSLFVLVTWTLHHHPRTLWPDQSAIQSNPKWQNSPRHNIRYRPSYHIDATGWLIKAEFHQMSIIN